MAQGSTPSRNKINYSEKLDKLCNQFDDEQIGDHFPSEYLVVADAIMYENTEIDGALEIGFSLCANCPEGLVVFSGISMKTETRYFVYAKDETDALRVWRKAVKAAKDEAKQSLL